MCSIAVCVTVNRAKKRRSRAAYGQVVIVSGGFVRSGFDILKSGYFIAGRATVRVIDSVVIVLVIIPRSDDIGGGFRGGV